MNYHFPPNFQQTAPLGDTFWLKIYRKICSISIIQIIIELLADMVIGMETSILNFNNKISLTRNFIIEIKGTSLEKKIKFTC